jgi:hypothetical protein
MAGVSFMLMLRWFVGLARRIVSDEPALIFAVETYKGGPDAVMIHSTQRHASNTTLHSVMSASIPVAGR